MRLTKIEICLRISIVFTVETLYNTINGSVNIIIGTTKGQSGGQLYNGSHSCEILVTFPNLEPY